jgi:hypothetical protein
MEWKELLQDLIQLVESAAPHLWRIAVKQAYVEAMQFGIAALAMFGIGCTLLFIAKKWRENDPFDDGDPNFVFPFVTSIFFFGLSLPFFGSAIGRLINPEYYAIELLINYVK